MGIVPGDAEEVGLRFRGIFRETELREKAIGKSV
jgi:hypothetical protein